MLAWRFDAQGMSAKEISETYILQNDIIKEYLRPDASERRFFLIGPKGCGKTLLLQYKAHLYWKKYNKDANELQQVNASKDLVESLDFTTMTLPESTILQLKDSAVWTRIWNFAIALVIIRKSKIGFPKALSHLEEEFEDIDSLSTVVSHILNHTNKFLNSEFFSELPRLLGRLGSLESTFVLFIDRLDQALNDLFISNEYDYLRDREPEAMLEVWRSAQYALLSVGYSLNTSHNRRIKIFATAREEALAIGSQVAINLKDYCVPLEYTEDELFEIFKYNIKLTPSEELWGGPHESPLYRFLGFEALDHIAARDLNGVLRREDAFKFILRHTFRRPREVVMIGRRIHEKVNGHRKLNPDKMPQHIATIRQEVTEVAWLEILKSYKSEFITGFKTEYIAEFIEMYRSNEISRENLELIPSEITDWLFRVGLLGYLEGSKQKFVPSSKYMYADEFTLPRSSWYMLHPVLDRELQKDNDPAEFYSKYNIIGHDYLFEIPEVYVPGITKGYPLAYYKPSGMAGEDLGRSCRIETSFDQLFLGIFIDDREVDESVRRQARIQAAFKLLATTTNLVAAEMIHAEFNHDFSSWMEELRDQIPKFRGEAKYFTRISDCDSTGLDSFADRLFGRLTTLGLLLYTKLNYGQIHSLVNQFIYGPKIKTVEEDSAVAYFRKAFFIGNLPSCGPLKPHEKDSVRNGMSRFEQEYLDKWWLNYSLHSLLPNGHFSEQHQTYLRKHFNID